MSRRFEHKFSLPLEVKPYLFAWWEPYLVRAPYTDQDGVYPVLSQYFDTPGLTMYRDKVDGVGRRIKVRLRTYGWRFSGERPCYLEIKHRDQETISKVRALFSGFRPEYTQPDSWAELDRNDLGPFASLAARFPLRQTAGVLYQREAYQGALDSSLRMTVDFALVALHPGECRRGRLSSESPRNFLPETEGILEIKSGGRLDDWVIEGIRRAGLRQVTRSKYALAMEALGLPQTEVGVFL